MSTAEAQVAAKRCLAPAVGSLFAIPLHSLSGAFAIGRLKPLRLSLCSRASSVYTRESQDAVYLINVRFASVKAKVHRLLPVGRKTADTTA